VEGEKQLKTPLLAFVHIEKTAGVSLNRMLRGAFGVRHFDVEPTESSSLLYTAKDFRDLESAFPYVDSIAGHTICPFNDLWDIDREVFFFTFLREPLARCASHYQFQVHKMGKTMSFESWIETEKYQNVQCRRLCGVPISEVAMGIVEERVSYIGVMDAFPQSVAELSEEVAVLGLPSRMVVQRKNLASDNSIKDKLLSDPSTLRLLEEANVEDQKLYDAVVSRRGGHPSGLAQVDATDEFRSTILGAVNKVFRNVVYRPYLSRSRR